MWYVIQVAPGQENRALEKCEHAFSRTECGDIFIPEYMCMKRYQGAWHREVKALFPGYLFVETDRPKEIEEVLCGIANVAKPVCIGGGFHPIHKDEEEFLKEIMNEHNVLLMSVGYIVDGRLVIAQGPLQGKAELVRRIDRHKRTAEVGLSLWGEERKATMGLEVKAKVSAEEYGKMVQRNAS